MMNEAVKSKRPTRIQRERTEQILAASLDVFSQYGYRGASINVIAETAGMTTPRLLYYFKDKEELYKEVLRATTLLWVGPLKAIDVHGEPVDEICAYIRAKLQMSKEYPKESRIFASEVMMGIPRARREIFEPLKTVFEEKIDLINSWMDQERLARQDPYHLFYSIWATTQHYADFEAQIAELSPNKMDDLFIDAETFLVPLYKKSLHPESAD